MSTQLDPLERAHPLSCECGPCRSATAYAKRTAQYRQCKGTTTLGRQCRHRTYESDDWFCRQHQKQKGGSSLMKSRRTPNSKLDLCCRINGDRCTCNVTKALHAQRDKELKERGIQPNIRY